jgi:hypothetical protein
MTKRHPCEDETYLTEEEEEQLHNLSKEYVNALEFDDQERARELRQAIKDLMVTYDDQGFWT